MRIAISNIAWEPSEDEAVAALLQANDVDAIDIAHPKYFADVRKASDADVQRVRTFWADRGIAITGMQSLLFGTTGLNLFGRAEVQQAMLSHLAQVCRIGFGLGATRLVFGSPKNRDRTGLSDERAHQIAVPFFEQLAAIAEQAGVVVCLEPNPPRYGCNFMTTSAETAAIVVQVGHPGIRMQLDIGALAINGETAQQVVRAFGPLIGHVHASEPGLGVLGQPDRGDDPSPSADHLAAGRAIAAALPAHVVTIEMLATQDRPHAAAIAAALDVAIAAYRTPFGANR